MQHFGSPKVKWGDGITLCLMIGPMCTDFFHPIHNFSKMKWKKSWAIDTFNCSSCQHLNTSIPHYHKGMWLRAQQYWTWWGWYIFRRKKSLDHVPSGNLFPFFSGENYQSDRLMLLRLALCIIYSRIGTSICRIFGKKDGIPTFFFTSFVRTQNVCALLWGKTPFLVWMV